MRKLTVIALTVALMLGMSAVVSNADHYRSNYDGMVTRYSGVDRFETAVQISRVLYPNGAENIYIANGHAFADSLSVASFQIDGPLLYVYKEQIPEATEQELFRLRDKRIEHCNNNHQERCKIRPIIIGGEQVVTTDVEDALRDIFS